MYKEGSNPPNIGDMFAGTIQREQIGKQYQPSRADVDMVMREYYPSVRRTMDAPSTTPQEFVDMLRTIKQNWIKTNGTPPSRPLLTSLPISERVKWLMEVSDNAIKQDERLLYIFCYDAALGIDLTTHMIGFAENTIKQDTDIVLGPESEVDEFLSSKNIGINVSVGKQVNAHLSLINDLADAATLLKEDPTGYLLVEEAAKRARKQSNRFRYPPALPSGHVPKFIAAGADLAEQAYKKIYKLTDGI